MVPVASSFAVTQVTKHAFIHLLFGACRGNRMYYGPVFENVDFMVLWCGIWYGTPWDGSAENMVSFE